MKIIQLVICFMTLFILRSIASGSENLAAKTCLYNVNIREITSNTNTINSSFEEPNPKEKANWNAAPKRGKPIRGHGN